VVWTGIPGDCSQVWQAPDEQSKKELTGAASSLVPPAHIEHGQTFLAGSLHEDLSR